MRDIKVKDKVKLRIPTGAETVGVVQEIEPNGVLVIDVTTQSTSRYRRSPELVELTDES